MKTSKERSRSGMTRRESVGAAPALAAFTIVPRHVLGGPARKPPSDKLNIAGIGVSEAPAPHVVRLKRTPGTGTGNSGHSALICRVGLH